MTLDELEILFRMKNQGMNNENKRQKMIRKYIGKLERKGLVPTDILDFIVAMFYDYSKFLLIHATEVSTEDDFNALKKEIIELFVKASKELEEFKFDSEVQELIKIFGRSLKKAR